MPTVEIADKRKTEDGHRELSFDLRDLLVHLTSAGQKLRWTILELWAVGEDSTLDLDSLKRKIESSPHGCEVTWERLLSISEGLSQMVDGVIAAFRGEPPTYDQNDLRDVCEIVIEAVDSDYWRVYATDEAIIATLRSGFTCITEVDEPLLPYHAKS